MFDVATRRQLQRWCVKQKKVFMGKATSNIHKIDENFGMLQKKRNMMSIFFCWCSNYLKQATMHNAHSPKMKANFFKNSSLFFFVWWSQGEMV